MVYCNICSSEFRKNFKSDLLKSVKHLEKLNQYYCKKSNLFMHSSEKKSHLESNDHKVIFKKVS